MPHIYIPQLAITQDEYDMIDMTMQEVEDYQLAKDLQNAKTKLTVIDGGKA